MRILRRQNDTALPCYINICGVSNSTYAGSIPDGVIGNFYWHNNSSGRTMALELTQPLTEMSTNTACGVKDAGA